ncbi:MAG: hypothetical protein WA839_11860 [Flavobacteriaceae bacterium]
MKNLENFGVQELDAKEVIVIEGGIRGGGSPWGYVFAGLLWIASEWDDISAGFSDGVSGKEYNYN